jgi:hypothetical protein
MKFDEKYPKSAASRKIGTLNWRNTNNEILKESKNKPCADCCKCYHPVLMDFDHRPGEIKCFNISNSHKSVSRERLKAEIDKCDVVCCLCHRIRTWNRNHPDAVIVLN